MELQHLFSIRETLAGADEPRERLRLCLAQARGFIHETSVEDVLDRLFTREEHRRAVRASVTDRLHVGFMIPDDLPAFAGMRGVCAEAKLLPDWRSDASTVFARELGVLVGRVEVPTTIVTVMLEALCGRSGYVELFIPAEEREHVVRWIDQEVGTHVGLTLTDSSCPAAVQDAFAEEGFGMPAFMRGRHAANYDEGVSVLYYDSLHGHREGRIELLTPMQERCGRRRPPGFHAVKSVSKE